MAGIKDSQEMVAFFGQFVSTTGNITADKKVNLFEIASYLQLWPVIAPAVDGYQNVVPELADLDSEERSVLSNTFADATKLPNAVAEELFEEGFDLALHVMQFIAKVREAKTGTVVA